MNVQLLHVEVPARHQCIAASLNLREAVVLRAMIADLRSLRMIDMNRFGVLLPAPVSPGGETLICAEYEGSASPARHH
jgi:hypothetical protein